MKVRRIVLSTALLLLPLAIGFGYARGDDAGAPADNGIGTSPSADDEPAAAAPSTSDQQLVCGVWLDTSLAAADARSLAGEPPDILVFPTARAGCSDAVSITWNLYPGRAFVRAVVWQGWRAREAATPHAYMTPEQPPAWRAAMLQRALPTPLHAGFDWLSTVLQVLTPLVVTWIGKMFTAQVKDSNRRTEIAGYADVAFKLVEALGKQQGWTGLEKYNRYIQEVVDSLKAAGQPELTGQEMAQLQQLATTKALMLKVHAVLPPARALPLPPPARG